MLDWEIEIKNYRCFSDENPARVTVRDGFTAFIGPNNAGKSTALKFFYEFRNLFRLFSVRDISANQSNITKNMWTGDTTAVAPLFERNLHELFHAGNDRDIEFKLRLLEPDEGHVEVAKFVVNRTSGSVMMSVVVRRNGQSILLPRQNYSNMEIRDGRWLSQNGNIFLDANEIISVASQLADSIYVGAFRNAIQVGSSTAYYDLKIGQAFIEEWRNFKTGPDPDQNLAAFQLTNEIREIFGFHNFEINPSADGKTLQLFVDDNSYVLSELGAGLAQFVILLAFVATRRPHLVLIDEPELNLHPRLQQDLLMGLKNYAQGPIIFATHNLGLARAVANGIYVCRKLESSTEIRPLSGHPRLAELLGELSFGGYQEIGFDKLLLVEGPHDVTAFRELLRLYGKDHEVVLMPLGGSSMINGEIEEQLHEIKRITSNIYAVVDSERDSESAGPAENVIRFAAACENTGITCHILERRAFENYLPLHAIQQVKGSKYGPLKSYQALNSLEPKWAKAENATIARAMKRDDIEGTDLGDFLHKL